MAEHLKNIKKEEVLQLVNLVDYQEGQIVSKTLAQNAAVSVTLFAFAKDEEISTHESNGDAMVTVLDGVGRFTVGGREYLVTKGETLVMPANVPHAVYAFEQFKMMLTVIF
ncbi:cupin region [Lachnospiraceae bacterium KM106-2]|nr:cupin region [Lachnospiraceae bacterium KM106-2]